MNPIGRWLTTLSHARLPRLFAAAALLGNLLYAEAAFADAASDAREHYERAIKLYEDGAYDAALVELTRAYEIRPSFRLMYNIGQARVAMRDYAGAIEAYQRYLREGGGQVTNDRVATVRAQLNDLQQRVGTLFVETDVPDSEVLIDDIVVGTAPLASPLVVNAGLRRVTVRHPDYPTRSQRIGIAGGEQHHVALTLRTRQPDAAAPAATSTDKTSAESKPNPPSDPNAREPAQDIQPLRAAATMPPGAERRDRTLAYVGTGVTAALVVGAAVLGVVTLSKNSDLKDRRNQPGIDVNAFDDDRETMKTLANITDGLGIAALAAAGVTTWLWLRDDGAPADRDAPSNAGSGIRVAFSGAGARIDGNF